MLYVRVKFAVVVMYYMHLKYDHKIFRALFTGPLMVAALTLVGLLFLFSKLAIKIGLLA
jgi:cytochrome c oxidase subunit 4